MLPRPAAISAVKKAVTTQYGERSGMKRAKRPGHRETGLSPATGTRSSARVAARLRLSSPRRHVAGGDGPKVMRWLSIWSPAPCYATHGRDGRYQAPDPANPWNGRCIARGFARSGTGTNRARRRAVPRRPRHFGAPAGSRHAAAHRVVGVILAFDSLTVKFPSKSRAHPPAKKTNDRYDRVFRRRPQTCQPGFFY